MYAALSSAITHQHITTYPAMRACACAMRAMQTFKRSTAPFFFPPTPRRQPPSAGHDDLQISRIPSSYLTSRLSPSPAMRPSIVGHGRPALHRRAFCQASERHGYGIGTASTEL